MLNIFLFEITYGANKSVVKMHFENNRLL